MRFLYYKYRSQDIKKKRSEKTLKEEAKITKIKRLQKNKKRTYLKRKKGEAAES
jgi:hypothetical protein